MTQQPTTAEIVAAAKQFLARANLAGGEVPAFNTVVAWLDEQARDPETEEPYWPVK